MGEDKEVKDLLTHCLMSGFKYPQTKQYLEDLGYYIPEDQFNAMKQVLDIQVDLDIGLRRKELKKY